MVQLGQAIFAWMLPVLIAVFVVAMFYPRKF